MAKQEATILGCNKKGWKLIQKTVSSILVKTIFYALMCIGALLILIAVAFSFLFSDGYIFGAIFGAIFIGAGLAFLEYCKELL